MPYLSPGSSDALKAAYPAVPARLRHALVNHPLLQLDQLATLADVLPERFYERRTARSVNGGGFPFDASSDSSVGDTIRNVAHGHSWVMLRALEDIPEYRMLLDTLLEEIDIVAAELTGKSGQIKGFIFISPPGTLTPFHFDAEYNILFQIRGAKMFATCPAEQPYLLQTHQQDYHTRGDNMLPWSEEFAAGATQHHLEPGDALYVPYTAPHWVEAGADLSISLSLTWQSRWSRDVGDAMRLNPLLHRAGLTPTDAPIWPKSVRWRALGYRVARKARLA